MEAGIMSVRSFAVSCKMDSPAGIARQLEDLVRQAAESGSALYVVERKIFDTVLEIGHAATEMFLHAQGDGNLGATKVSASGQTLERSDTPVERPLRTVFGQHTIEAFVYSPGPHEKISLRPIDARLELSDRHQSYLFEEFSQYFCVDQAFPQASRAIETVLRQKVSVDTLEHINRQVGEQADGFLNQLPVPPPSQEGELLVFTGDGKGVPLVTADARALPAFKDRPERPGNRRMAILAGVYSVDRYVRTPEDIVAALFRDGERPRGCDRPKPKFKHVRACFPKVYDAEFARPTIVPGSFEAFSWANEEVARRRRRNQPLIRIMDGQKSLWEVADACLESVPIKETIDILDVLHVSQYVWRAAGVFHGTFEHREAFARDRLLRILQGGVRGVIRSLRRMATQRGLTGQKRREITIICNYFKNNIHRMRYDVYLRNGYPIATGVIEGACRHLVKDRMERSGMRWRLNGAQAMLNVRAVWQSSYWDEFQTYRIEEEQAKLHPNRALIRSYQPCRLAA
jgi:hypothetical protein